MGKRDNVVESVAGCGALCVDSGFRPGRPTDRNEVCEQKSDAQRIADRILECGSRVAVSSLGQRNEDSAGE